MALGIEGIEVGANVFDAVLGSVFLILVLGRKEGDRKNLRFYIITAIYIFGLAAIQDKPEQFLVQSIVIFCAQLLYGRMALAGSLMKQVAYSMLFMIAMVSAAMITNFFTYYSFHVTTLQVLSVGSTERVESLLLDKLLLCGMLLAVVLLKRRGGLAFFDWLLGIGAFVAILCIVVPASQIASESNEFARYGSLFLVILLGFVLLCVITIWCMYRLNIQRQYKLENEIMRTKLKEEACMLKKGEEMYESNRILRHDLKRYLTSVQGLLICGEVEEAKRYIETAVDTHFDGKFITYTSSSIINAVINDKKNVCEKNQIAIAVCVNGTVPEKLQMDLGIILSNLMENAFEAELVQPTEERFIRIFMQRYKGMYLIRVENYIEESILKQNPNLISGKKDAPLHGIGIRSIKSMVEEREGSFFCREMKNVFVAQVLLPGH